MAAPPRKALSDSVILAEDHDVTRFGMAQFLRNDMRVADIEGVATFPEAMSALSLRHYPLAIFDLDLPGLTAARDLEGVRRAYPDMRVVVMSGFETREHILAALTAGVHGYIPKRLPLPEVGRLLARVMDGEIYVPPSLADLPAPLTSPGLSENGHPIDEKHLTRRQLDVLAAMSEGFTNKEIGNRLNLTESTIKLHAAGLFQSLGVKNRAQAVVVGQKYLAQKR